MKSAPANRLGRLRVLLLCVALLLPLAAAAIDALPFKDRAEEQRFQNLTRQLRCLVCQNESLADSSADLAKDLRQEVFEQMRQGKSDAEIKRYLTARYSDFVLYNPPLRGGTFVLWFGPLLVLLIGSAIVFRIVRRRGATKPSAAPASTNEEDW
ncbi:MAG: cytochrome c-type biogenesis protein [Dokdonella sp.]|nr:cytochrome c-type biogenesis protein CcmH [Dokdonella sp.]MCB1569584.1 cytochrome c-type biogenesis protein CcmH [Xanthomonadales bacterium]MCB1572352.1 cytochrome c-type biogenesis protein CcmH [Xanthomonadales bacterium]MCB1576245.1 cytochrome c-type biogenesis protein CcmH [Xanthomonadales bacterium]